MHTKSIHTVYSIMGVGQYISSSSVVVAFNAASIGSAAPTVNGVFDLVCYVIDLVFCVIDEGQANGKVEDHHHNHADHQQDEV